jgi:predicted house-cleaning noncanonical NTP pyrophosphatase (MazG superfamily)
MPTYNKLVRDLIPDIIEKSGKTCTIRILDDSEYVEALQEKFVEEFEEYKQATNRQQALEELADLLEILYAFASYHGATKEELEAIRRKKAEERGGFQKRIFLIGVEK